jgi:hypothetical protein
LSGALILLCGDGGDDVVRCSPFCSRSFSSTILCQTSGLTTCHASVVFSTTRQLMSWRGERPKKNIFLVLAKRGSHSNKNNYFSPLNEMSSFTHTSFHLIIFVVCFMEHAKINC